jgi:hypothetical protein
MANIGKEIEIVEIPEPMAIPDTVPVEEPVAEPDKIPALT